MVAAVFPAVKLGILFVKQISKPLAQVLVRNAKNHPVFRTYFIIPPAQFYHWAEVKAKMYLMNLGKPAKVAKLNEQMAIELGANLMGEVIIFSVAGGCLLLEYSRQQAKETKKEEARQAQLQKFQDDIQGLHVTTVRQEEEIAMLQRAIDELAKRTKHKIPSLEKMKNDETARKRSSGESDSGAGGREKSSEPGDGQVKEEQSLDTEPLIITLGEVFLDQD